MLAEFREQKKFIDELPNLRMTFERFVQRGHNKRGHWERTEPLQYEGKPFLLDVRTSQPKKSLLDADLIITISGPDGREVVEVLPSRQSIIDKHNADDYVDLPGRLKELKAVVDKFLNPHVRMSRGIGSG